MSWGENSKHRFSTYFLIALLIMFVFVGIASALHSEDLDDICDGDNMSLFRWNGTWQCLNFLDGVEINFTSNNITYVFTNFSYHANSSMYWDDYNQPIDIEQMGSVLFNEVNTTTLNVSGRSDFWDDIIVGGDSGIQLDSDASQILFDTDFDDVFIAEVSNNLNIYARGEVNKNKFMSFVFNNAQGAHLEYGPETVPVFYGFDVATGESQTLGTVSYPWRAYVQNISDGTNTVTPTEIIDINNTAQAGYYNFSYWENDTDTGYLSHNGTTIINGGLRVINSTYDDFFGFAYFGNSSIYINQTISVHPFANGFNGLQVDYRDSSASSVQNYPLYVNAENISTYGGYIKSWTERDTTTYGFYVDHTSRDDDKQVWGSFFKGSGNATAYGFQGYGYTTGTKNTDAAIGVYGYTGAPSGDANSSSIAFYASPLLADDDRKWAYVSQSGHNLFSRGNLYLTNNQTSHDYYFGYNYFDHINHTEDGNCLGIENKLEVQNDTFLHGVVNISGNIGIQGNPGLTQTVSVRKGDDSGACNLVFVSGILTSTTC